MTGVLARGRTVRTPLNSSPAAPRRFDADAAVGAVEDAVGDGDVPHPARHLAADHDPAVPVGHGAIGDRVILRRPAHPAAVLVLAGLDRDAIVAHADVAVGD